MRAPFSSYATAASRACTVTRGSHRALSFSTVPFCLVALSILEAPGSASNARKPCGPFRKVKRMRTLVLNAGYEPLAVVSFKRAIVLVLNEKATIVASDDDHPVYG